MLKRITIHLAPGSKTPGVLLLPKDVAEVAGEFNAKVEAMFPGSTDPELSQVFETSVEPSQADKLAEALLKCEGVTGAYVKPDDFYPT